MTSARLQSFSDGVLAIIITITVLGIQVPTGDSLSSLVPLLPIFLIYASSFQVIGTYWNSHHHLFKVAKEVNGSMMWANLYLLFFLSLVPFATAWLGEHFNSAWPTALYCSILLASGLAYGHLVRVITKHERETLHVTSLVSRDSALIISPVLYAIAIAFAFFLPLVSYLLVVAVAAIWFIPERRYRRLFGSSE